MSRSFNRFGNLSEIKFNPKSKIKMIDPNSLPQNEARLLGSMRGLKAFDWIEQIVLGSIQSVAYLPTKDGIYFCVEFPSAAHEIAHMVEMKLGERILMPDWGMNIITVGDLSRKFSTSALFAAAAREVRVRAIEEIISGKERPEVLNSYWRADMEKFCPFGRFKTMKDIETWGFDLRERTKKAWNFDRVEFEWNKRIDYIHNWMETN